MKTTDGYLKFLSFPTISADSNHSQDLVDCCRWLKIFLEEIGFKTELWNEKGTPSLFASHCGAGDKKPTLLLYTHYDVQPVDPLDLWDSPPFEPKIKNGEVYARGAQDNKGQCWYVLQALRRLHSEGEMPINIKLIIDGEEEIGSFSLHEILPNKRNDLKADYLAIVDLGIPEKKTPAITLGTRGLVALDLEVTCAKSDLHSGTHGGVVNNPVHIIVDLLSQARNRDGSIAIPGFYDNMMPFSQDEKKSICFDFDKESYEKLVGTKASGGETAYSPLESAWIRPTLEVNGISGGYGGEGVKTVLPAHAQAKISARLVPGQNPDDILEKLTHFFESKSFEGVNVSVTPHHGSGAAVRTKPDSKVVQAFAKAYADVFEKPCKFILEGGSIPIVPELQKASGAEIVMVGLGLISDQIHAPNEHFGLDRIEMGTDIIEKSIRNLSLLQNYL